MQAEKYQIKIAQFEGPYDLLLFFVERDELDIYDINITKLITDFLDYIHHQKNLNIELSSEFILFVATLMRIKAKMLLPARETDESGNPIDPRQEVINSVRLAMEQKSHKEIASHLAALEAQRNLIFKRGNVQNELNEIGKLNAEGTEIQSLTLFKLMRSFERVLAKYNDAVNKPTHIVERYNHTIEESRNYLLQIISEYKSVSFEKIFEPCQNKIHAIFLFLSMLELIQQNFFTIMVGEHKK